jgi:16S rRNA (guanine(527)-N(7))-methyltransferase RsmG
MNPIADLSARGKIDRYLSHLGEWSKAINLTAAGSRDEAFETLVAPILGGETLLAGHVIDVGSGNGSPGLILAALRPDLSFTLLEPRAKRWAFLRQAAREMGISNVEATRERSDTYKGRGADTVTMRAVGLDPETLLPLLIDGKGQVLVFGGPELRNAQLLRATNGARIQRVCFT